VRGGGGEVAYERPELDATRFADSPSTGEEALLRRHDDPRRQKVDVVNGAGPTARRF
jgi:hypothetical protein